MGAKVADRHAVGRRAAAIALPAALIAACCNSPSPERKAAPSASAAPSQAELPPLPPAPKNLSIGKLTADDVRNGIRRAGWSLTAELGTQFDSCKITQFDVRKGGAEGTAQLHECTDEYDARRRESAVKNAGDDVVIEREAGRMFEVRVQGDGAEARKLFGSVLGRGTGG